MEKEAWCTECEKEVGWHEKEHYEHSVISIAEKARREHDGNERVEGCGGGGCGR
jgi:hypothetical protein